MRIVRRFGLIVLVFIAGVVVGGLGRSAPSRPQPIAAAEPTSNVQPTVTTAVRATVQSIPPTVQPQPTVTVHDEPITLSGSGIEKTKPFALNGGNYTLSWSAKSTSSVGCYNGGFLRPVDGSQSSMIMNATVQNGVASNGETQAYRLKAGQYYLDMTSGCDWSVTVKPLS